MEEQIKQLWERVVAIEKKLETAAMPVVAVAKEEFQVLLGELKNFGIHSTLHTPTPEYVYGAEGQTGAWTEAGDGTGYPQSEKGQQ